MTMPRILIIAGSDSGGGAGIQADIKTVTMLGGHAMTAITAITAQNTLGVQGVYTIPTDMVLDQIDSVVSDIGVDAVKIGMVGSAETARGIAELLGKLDGVPVVFDPVMVASSGAELADKETVAAFDALLSVSTLITPNRAELAALTGMPVGDEAEIEDAADELLDRASCAVLATGCRLDRNAFDADDDAAIGEDGDDQIFDILLRNDQSKGDHEYAWHAARIDSQNDHGTGCTLSSAIATGLGAGLDMAHAIARARLFVRLAMREAPGLGAGHGPMGHGRVRLDVGDDLRLNHAVVPVGDYASACDFYARLGLKLIVDSPDKPYARFAAPGGATLSLFGDTPALYFECDDLDARVAALKAAGIEFETEPRTQSWGAREAWLRDPAGNPLCLFSAGEMRRHPPGRIGG